MNIIEFDKAIALTNDAKRHLLLGNGFSISCIPNIFTYKSIFEQANFSQHPEIPEVFKRLNTEDFEIVVKSLENASEILEVYQSGSSSIQNKLKEHAIRTKEILLSTLALNHPVLPSDISEEKYSFCRRFLSHFLHKSGGKVYTLNYDLLLYWALMHKSEEEEIELYFDDGFGKDSWGKGANYWVSSNVTWQGETKSDSQRIYYLHGALHLFDRGKDLEKFTWSNSGLPLLQQARNALDMNKFPLFVSEGTSELKLSKVNHSAYLHHCYKSFSRTMENKNSILFTFGFSFSENDEHIIEKIKAGKIKRIYVGIYGDPNLDTNVNIITRCERLIRERDEGTPLEIFYYNSSSAKVWG